MWNCSSKNMTERNLFFNDLFLVLVIISCAISKCSSAISDKRLCYDPDCSEPVSLARTIVKYVPGEAELLPFSANANVKVYSKEAGNRTDLWGVEIEGKRGYVPKQFLREYHVYRRKLKHIVPTKSLVNNNGSSHKVQDIKENENKSLLDTKNIEASSNPIDNLNLPSTPELPQKEIHSTPPYEVVDGTTIYSNQDVSPTQTKLASETIEPMVLVNKEAAVNNSGIGLSNGSIKSNNFTDSDKVPEVGLIDKIEKEKQKVSGEYKHAPNIEEKAAVSFNEQNNLNLNEAIKYNDITSNVQIGENNETVGTPASENEAIVTVNSITLNLPHTTNSDKSETENEQSSQKANNSEITNTNEAQSLKGETFVTTSNVKSDAQKADSSDTIEVQSPKSAAIAATSNINSDIQEADSSDASEMKEAQSPKSESLVTTSNVKSDVQRADSSETIEVQSPKSAAIVLTGNINSDMQKADNSNTSEMKEAQSPKSEAIVENSNVKSDTKETNRFDTSETKEAKSPKSEAIVENSNVKSDTKETNRFDPSETKEVQSPKSEALVTTSNVKSDIQKADSSDTSEMKEAQSPKSEALVTTNVKSDIQKADSSDTSEMKEAQSPNSEAIIENSNVKSDTKETNRSDTSETKEAQSPKSEALVTTNVKSDIQKADSSDTSEMKEAQSPKSEAIIENSNVKSDTKETNRSDTSETKEAQSPKSEAIIANSNVKSDTKETNRFDPPETKEAQSPNSEALVTTNVKSDIQKADSSDTSEMKEAQSPKSEAIIANSNVKFNIQEADSSDTLETEDSQSAETRKETAPFLKNLITIINNDSISEIQHEEEFGKIVPKDTDISESITTDLNNNTETEVGGINALATIDEKSSQLVESITSAPDSPDMKDVRASDSESVGEVILDVQPSLNAEDSESVKEATSQNIIHDVQVSTPDVCTADSIECSPENNVQNDFSHHDFEDALMERIHIDGNHWMTLMYLSVTAIATLIFSLGYYRIENMRRDRQLIARINKLEKELLISDAELTMVNENLKSTKEKLNRMEDESFGSDEMVLSLRADLESLQNAKVELEDQVVMLEKDLESATEAGLELEKMLREVLSANNEVNPLAQSVEDLQTRLNAQQAANESLTNALGLKTQENESLSTELLSVKKKYEELEVEFTRATENLKLEVKNKSSIEQILNDKVQKLEMQIKEISTEKATLQKKLKGKEVEANDLIEVIHKLNSSNLDLDKLYNVSHIKAEATALLEERNELKIRLAEVEGAYNLLEEHVKVVKEEIATLSEQCKVAEKEKKDAETRLEVLTNFFEEKEAQRQKEEAIWLQQQGEVVSTVERIQMLQNEIQNYKQQVEMLKREILDQEREYKGQISLLETKAHEQWVIARQVERHLEESKVEAGQLRNRLTLIEKNLNDVDSEAKLHRLAANGETTSSPPLFIGAEPCNYPIMFSGSTSGPLPPPPSYLHSLFPPYLPPPLPNASEVPPYEVNQRPPPLGARLSSPPPMPPIQPPTSNRYDNAGSLPPMSPHLLPPPLDHRSPLPPYSSEIYPPPPPPPGSMLPPSLGVSRSWGEEWLPPPRNSGFHPAQRERVRNHKDSLHSSGESLDKSHHSKV